MNYVFTKENPQKFNRKNHEGFGPMFLKDFQRWCSQKEAMGVDDTFEIIFSHAENIADDVMQRPGYVVGWFKKDGEMWWTHANAWFTEKIKQHLTAPKKDGHPALPNGNVDEDRYFVNWVELHAAECAEKRNCLFDGCEFAVRDCGSCVDVRCEACQRKDGRDVVFKEVKQ